MYFAYFTAALSREYSIFYLRDAQSLECLPGVVVNETSESRRVALRMRRRLSPRLSETARAMGAAPIAAGSPVTLLHVRAPGGRRAPPGRGVAALESVGETKADFLRNDGLSVTIRD